jgi:hypothetical protein
VQRRASYAIYAGGPLLNLRPSCRTSPHPGVPARTTMDATSIILFGRVKPCPTKLRQCSSLPSRKLAPRARNPAKYYDARRVRLERSRIEVLHRPALGELIEITAAGQTRLAGPGSCVQSRPSSSHARRTIRASRLCRDPPRGTSDFFPSRCTVTMTGPSCRCCSC